MGKTIKSIMTANNNSNAELIVARDVGIEYPLFPGVIAFFIIS
jgi:hypothetical protein